MVLSLINRLGLSDEHDYERLEQFAIEGMRFEMRVHGAPSIRVHREIIPGHGVIQFPDDYIRHTKIGVCVSDRIYTLTMDESICPTTPQVCATIDDAAKTDDAYYIIPHSYNGFAYGAGTVPALYMQGGGLNPEGYYRLDKDNRQIILKDVFVGKELVIEYQAMGEINGQTIVPPLWVDALRYYISWKYFEYQPGQEQRASLEHTKYNEYFHEAKVHEIVLTSDELLDLLYEVSHHKLGR